MSNKYFKIGVFVMLLVLLFGPMLQGRDCFNDAPNRDHDAVLHTTDALICVAVVVALSCLVLWFIKVVRWFQYLMEEPEERPLFRSFSPLRSIAYFARPPVSLRI